MSTLVGSISNDKFFVKFNEQYASRGLDRAIGSLLPHGILHGFTMKSSATALSVDLEVDPAMGDSVAIVRAKGSTDPLAIVYQESADITVSLSAHVSTTIHLGVKPTYVIGSETLLEIRAYSEAEFTAGTTDEAILFGKVVVPAAGVIANSSITRMFADLSSHYTGATGKWQQVDRWQVYPWGIPHIGAIDAFTQSNGTFEHTATKRHAGSLGGSVLISRVAGTYNPQLGTYNIFRTLPGRTAHVVGYYRVNTGDGYTVGVGPHGIYVDWYDVNGDFLSETLVGAFSGSPTLDTWTRVAASVFAPASSIFARIRVAAAISAGEFYVADVVAYTELESDTDSRLPALGGGPSHFTSIVSASRLIFDGGAYPVGFSASATQPFMITRVEDLSLELTVNVPGGATFGIGTLASAATVIDLVVSGFVSADALRVDEEENFNISAEDLIAQALSGRHTVTSAPTPRIVTPGALSYLDSNGTNTDDFTFDVPLPTMARNYEVSSLGVWGYRANSDTALVVSVIRKNISTGAVATVLSHTFTIVAGTQPEYEESAGGFSLGMLAKPDTQSKIFLRVRLKNATSVSTVRLYGVSIGLELQDNADAPQIMHG